MKTHSGFTIIELMIVVALAAVLLTIGIPGFQEMVQDNRRASASVEMVAAIQSARSEAVKQNQPVTLCPTSDNTNCSGGNAWEIGWMTFIDDDDDGIRDAGEELLRTGSSIPAIAVSSTFESLTYASNGRMTTNDGNSEAEFILCDSRGASEGRFLLILRSGRPETSDTDLNNAALSSCRTP